MSAREYVDLAVDYAKRFNQWSDRKYYIRGDDPHWVKTVEDHSVLEISILGTLAYSAITGRVGPENVLIPILALGGDVLKNKTADYVFERWSNHSNLFEKIPDEKLDE